MLFSEGFRTDEGEIELTPGLRAILATPLVSNLKRLDLDDLCQRLEDRGLIQEDEDEGLWQYLGNCLIVDSLF